MSKPANFKEALERDLASLKQAREELLLQLTLAKADARDDWKLLEKTWANVETECKRIATHTREPVKEMGESARALIDELKSGYARIKSQIKHSAGAGD